MSRLYTITVSMVVEVEDLGRAQQVQQDPVKVAEAVRNHLQRSLAHSYTMGGYRFLTDTITTAGVNACLGYLIDATARTVTPITFNGLDDVQKLVGGYLEGAFRWPNDDVLYVDEEGLLKNPQHFFRLLPERPDQMLAGNGVLVGREEVITHFPLDFTNHPPSMTIEDLRRHIRFVSKP